MVCIVKRRAILVLPAGPSMPPRKSFAFPRCLAFAKLDTRKKEALTSKLAYGSSAPSRPPRKALLSSVFGFRQIGHSQERGTYKQACLWFLRSVQATSKKLRFSSVFGFRQIGHSQERGTYKQACSASLLLLSSLDSMLQHVFNKYPVSSCGVIDKNMGHRPH
jgi:hypothetical protein